MAEKQGWDVTVIFNVTAPDRDTAWQVAREVCKKRLADLATVNSVSQKGVVVPYVELKYYVNEALKLGKPEMTKRH